ncbi:hypothetical protein M231_04819 [Tremella mesenterica]|uniref:Uncharacterized protein n=1 Tax=Tremella mesenterica TaxID=5217 RepID=A0A4Q1BJY4_TREME|nr:hypothetical protein M231_04819 [Tremella mesenterica]
MSETQTTGTKAVANYIIDIEQDEDALSCNVFTKTLFITSEAGDAEFVRDKVERTLRSCFSVGWMIRKVEAEEVGMRLKTYISQLTTDAVRSVLRGSNLPDTFATYDINVQMVDLDFRRYQSDWDTGVTEEESEK